eukprot:15473710-Alexandrium_andersonii.AAC.1
MAVLHGCMVVFTMWVVRHIMRVAAHTTHAVVLAARLRGCARTHLNAPAPAPQPPAKACVRGCVRGCVGACARAS